MGIWYVSDSTVSAEPENLLQYASASEQIDHALLTEVSRMLRNLEIFEARCKEAGFSENATSQGASLKDFCYDNLHTSNWVKAIAQRFLVVDSIWVNPTRSLESSIRQIVLATLLPGISVSFLSILSNVPRWLISTMPSKQQTITNLDSNSTINPPSPPTPPLSNTKAHVPVSKEAGSLSGGVHSSYDKRGVAIDINRKDRENHPNPKIHSIRTGSVVKAGSEKGYGNYVKVLQDDGKVVLYAHLEEASQYKNGDPIEAGDVIGNMGKTGGTSTGVHLHLEFRQPEYDNEGNYTTDQKDFWSMYTDKKFDPIQYLKDNNAWISD